MKTNKTLEALMEGFNDRDWNLTREALESIVKTSTLLLLSHSGASELILTLSDDHVIEVRRKSQWENVSSGEYDDTMRCTRCGFEYMQSADVPSEENERRSKHACRRVAR